MYQKNNVNRFKFVNDPRFAKADISIILLYLRKYQNLYSYENLKYNWFKFIKDQIFANGDRSTIWLFLRKYQLFKFISYSNRNSNLFKFCNR